ALKHVVLLVVVFGAGTVINVVKLTGFFWRGVENLQRIFAVVIFGSDAVFRHDLAVHKNVHSLDADSISRCSDDSLHVVCQDGPVVRTIVTLRIVRIAGILENDDVATPDFSLWEERKRRAWREDEFVYE